MTDHWAFGARSSADDVLRGHDLSGRTAIVTGANTGIPNQYFDYRFRYGARSTSLPLTLGWARDQRDSAMRRAMAWAVSSICFRYGSPAWM